MELVWEFDPQRLTECLLALGADWADKNAAASLLERAEDAVHSQATSDLSVAIRSFEERKHAARKASVVTEHIAKAIEARKEANKARVRYESYKVYVELLRSEQANRREELKKLGMHT